MKKKQIVVDNSRIKFSDPLSDLEILRASYVKYKDKNGRKAQNLKTKIHSLEAFEQTINDKIKELNLKAIDAIEKRIK